MVAKVNFSVKERIQIWSIVEEAGYYHKIEKNRGVARIFQRRWEGGGLGSRIQISARLT